MTVKKVIAATGVLVGVTLGTATASFAQYYGGPYGYGGYGGPYGGLYDYAPGYGRYYGDVSPPYWLRGGPGPRVGGGSGTGIGAQR